LTVLQNQNLCKLINYNTSNPLNEPDLDDPSSLLFQKIYPLPKLPDTDTEKCSFLNIFFDDFRLPNLGVKEGYINFDVICHIDLWRIDGMIRPFSILHEIDEMFNYERIAGIRKLLFDRVKYLYVNEKYTGYRASYKITSGN